MGYFVSVTYQNLILILLFALGSSSFAQGQSTPSPRTPQAWAAAAVRDVDAAYDLYVQNHPGMLNEHDPGFRARLEVARHRGLKLAAQVNDRAGLAATLDAFSAELRDGHAIVFADPTSAPGARWPGFVPAWRGNALFVFASEIPELKPGAKILGCDGVDTRNLVLRNVFAFGGRPSEPGQWWTQARNLFQDDGNPFIKLPTQCRFSTQGRVLETVLHWRPADKNYSTWRKVSYNGDTLPLGMTEPRPGLAWIVLSTFEPNATERDIYRKMFSDIRARRAELLTDKAIVIDLRQNQGGSSDWSLTLAKALWGDGRVEQFEASDPNLVWWRASRDNTEYVASLAGRLNAESETEMSALMHKVADGMQTALAKGHPFYVEPSAIRPLIGDFEKNSPPLTTPVYVIVPGQCASACLDALDIFTHFPNTKLIGAPSSADSAYLEIRLTTLPDRTSKIVIPVKMYRIRRRAPGQAYSPALEVDDLSWSTAAFQKIIESDLRIAK